MTDWDVLGLVMMNECGEDHVLELLHAHPVGDHVDFDQYRTLSSSDGLGDLAPVDPSENAVDMFRLVVFEEDQLLRLARVQGAPFSSSIWKVRGALAQQISMGALNMVAGVPDVHLYNLGSERTGLRNRSQRQEPPRLQSQLLAYLQI